jgi:LPXTG-site transpeptidase (sortase) family protein
MPELTNMSMKKIAFKKGNILSITLGVLLIAIGLGGNFRIGLSNYENTDAIGVENALNLSPSPGLPVTKISQPADKQDGSDFKYGPHREEINSPVSDRQSRIGEDSDKRVPAVPDKMEIPGIGLVAPVIRAEAGQVEIDGTLVNQWQVPNYFAGGWHPNSALLGSTGNTVISGHHNAYGEVFVNLVNIQIGDQILVYAGEQKYEYQVSEIMILPDRFENLETRLENARWISSTDDERLTLVTCWPYESNTHRLIVVAMPISDQQSVDITIK